VIVVAHHDAAHSGLVFEPELPRALLRRLPRRVLDKHANTTPPTMWGSVLGPALVAAGALLGRGRLRTAGTVLSAGYAAAMADIGLRSVVPGANDNASGVAAALSLAHWLAADPPPGLRAVILLPGAEESFMEGMIAWCDRHLAGYDPATTTVLTLDTVGSPRLVALEGEGMLTMNEYPKDLLEALHEAAAELGITLLRDLRFRNATDGLITLKRGYRTAMIGSVDEYKIPPNYHWPTDTADRVDYDSVADAARLCRRVIEKL
jgi:Zn-dependent M28 family amino/carboxypeptidase